MPGSDAVSLVTGGAGFLGSHLCDRLLAEGHTVVCIDNLITGDPANIAHLLGNARFRFIHHDVTQPAPVNAPIDAVLHMASPASPPEYMRLGIETLRVGSVGVEHTLDDWQRLGPDLAEGLAGIGLSSVP